MTHQILISIARQRLELRAEADIVASCLISTARAGPGEEEGSYQTPRGRHVVHQKIGAGAAPGTVFVGRVPTGERISPALLAEHPDRDWITTRIIRLAGCEPDRNQGGRHDSLQRQIYIHGSPHVEQLGIVGSHGCIRMSDDDVIGLFDQIEVGDTVLISEF